MQQETVTESFQGDCQWEIIDHLDYGIAICSPHTQTLEKLNIAFANVHGYTIAQLKGKSWQTLVIPQAREEWLKRLKQAQNQGSQTWETQHLSGQGTPLTVKVTLKAIASNGIKYYLITVEPVKVACFKEVSCHAVMKAVAEGVVVQQADGQIIACNTSAEKILGVRDGQIIGLTSDEPIWRAIKEDGSPFRGEDHPAMITLRSGKPQHNVIMGIYKSEQNSPTWLSINAQPLFRNGESQPYAVVTTFTDITERHHQQKELCQSQLLIESIINASPQLFYIYNQITQCFTYVNGKVSEIVGYSPDEIIQFGSKLLAHLVAPEDWAVLKNRIAHLETLKNGEVLETEYRIRHKNGSVRWLRSREVVFTRTRDNRPEQILGTAVDITEHKLTENQLRDSQARLKTIITNIADGILIIDREGKVRFANPAAAQLFNRPLEELLAHTLGVPIVPHQTTELTIIREPNQMGIGEMRVTQTQWDGEPVYVVSVRDITERRAAETALRESEERLRATFEQTAVGISYHGCQGRFLWVNQKFCDILGYSETELQQMSYFDITHPDDLALQQSQYAPRLMANEISAYSMDKRYIRKDGSVIWINLSTSVVRSETGEIKYSLSIIKDISDRKQAEKDLRESEHRFRQIAENIREVFYIVNRRDNQLLYISPAYEQIWGQTCESLHQNPNNWIESIHPEDCDRVIGNLKQVLSTLDDFNQQYRIIRPDGSIRWIWDRAFPSYNSEGEFIYYVGLAEDITERKEAEQQLRFQAQLLDNVRESIIATDLEGKVIYWGKGAQDLYGYSAEEVLGKLITFIVEPQNIEEEEKRLAQVREKGYWQDQYWQRRKDGSLFWAETFVSLVKDEKGQAIGLIGIDRNITERKQAEQALQDSEARFRAIFEQASVGMSLSSPSGLLLRVNQKLCQFFGYSEIELLGLDWETLTYPEDRNSNLSSCQCERIIRGEIENYSLEKRYIRKDGQIIWGHLNVTSIYDSKAKVHLCLSIIEDITERKQTTEALRREREFKSKILDNLPIGIAVHPLNYTNILYLNEQFCQIYGQSVEALTSLNTFFETVFPDFEYREQIKTQVLADINSGEPEKMHWEDLQIQTQTGDTKIICAKNIPLYEQELMISTVWDVSALKKAEAELRESEYRFRTIFEKAAIGIAQVEITGRFLQVNLGFCKILGYTESELLQLKFQNVTHPEDLKQEIDYIHQILTNKITHYSLEKRYICKNGQPKWVKVTISLFRDLSDNPLYFIKIIEDIEQQKQAQIEMRRAKEAAEAANSAKSQFLANMSHELRTPLNAILGFTQIMTRSSATPPEQRKYLEVVSRSGEHLLSLINDILDLSKIEAGRTIFQEESFNLEALLDSLKKMFEVKAKVKNLDLFFEIDPNIPQSIKTDQTKLRSTLINLLENAIKFTHSGQVILRVTEGFSQERVAEANQEQQIPDADLLTLHIEVEDTGIGIAAEDIHIIFDSFVQTRPEQTALEGTGLGLAICRHFVRMMGGELTVKSTLGVGSIFQFDLICHRVNTTNPQIVRSPRQIMSIAPDQPQYRILVVEDQEGNRELLVNLLESVGFEVRTAENGAIAVEIWRDWQPHLIWMDMRMPVMNGYEATKEIRASLNGDQPIIIALTASVLEQERSTIFTVGCNDFVGKPFHQEIIYEKMSQYLGVRYLYKDKGNELKSQSLDPSPKLLSEDELKTQIFQMKADWVAQLHQAAISARETRLIHLIKQISQNNQLLALTLTHLVNKLAFEKIANLTNSGRNESKN